MHHNYFYQRYTTNNETNLIFEKLDFIILKPMKPVSCPKYVNKKNVLHN